MPSTDLTLLSRWIDHRDAQAFKELATEYAPRVYATCKRILRDASEAQDVTQECFIKLARVHSSPADSLGAWLHRVATNRALDCIRKDKRRRRREATYAAQHPVSTATTWDDISSFVDEAIAELPNHLRIPVVEHFYNDRSHAQIAEELGLSRQTVTYRIAGGIQALRKKLRKRGIVIATGALADLLLGNLAEAAVLPPSLTGALGTLALAGPPAAVSAGLSLSFLVSWKAAVIGAAVLAVAVTVPVLQAHVYTPHPESTGQETADVLSAGQPKGPATTGENTLLTQHEAAGKGLQESALVQEGEGPSMVGRVYDAQTGIEVPEASIRVIDSTKRHVVHAFTDSSGRFVFAGLHEGTYAVWCTHAPGFPFPTNTDTKTVTIKADAPVEVEFALSKGLSVTGIVLDADGIPVSKAYVSGLINSRAGYQSAQSRENGAFTLLGFVEGDEITVHASKTIDDATELKSYEYRGLIVQKDGLRGLEIVAHELTTISGRVVDAAGKPVAKVYVLAAPEQYLVAPPCDWQGAYRGAFSDSKGVFKIKDLFAGDWQVGFEETGVQQVVSTSPGEDVAGLTLVFTGEAPKHAPHTRTLSITGRVTAPDGNPIADVTIRANKEGTHSHSDSARTDAEGLFAIEGLSDGMYSLKATHPQYNTFEREGVAAETRGIQIQLTRRTPIEGRVVQADTGEPVTAFTVGLVSARAFAIAGPRSTSMRDYLSQGILLHVLDPDGRFLLEDTEPGDTYVFVAAEGFGWKFVPVSVSAAAQEPVSVTVRLQPEARIEGRVVTDRNTPVEGAYIFDMAVRHSFRRGFEETKKGALTRSDSSGAFTIAEQPGGPITLSVYHPNHPVATVETVLLPGKITPLTIELSNAGEVQGTVLYDGKPVAGQSVLLSGESKADRTQTSAEGTYSFSGVRPGQTRVWATLNGDRIGPSSDSRNLIRTAIVEGGYTTTVDFNFLPAEAGLEGVVSLGGSPPERYSLKLAITTSTGDVETFANPREEGGGMYHFENVPPGAAKLQAAASRGDEKVTAWYDVQIEKGKTLSFDIDFSEGCVLEGGVTGKFVHEQCRLFMYSHDRFAPEKLERMLVDHTIGMDNTDICAGVADDGTFHVAGLSPGDYTAVVIAVDTSAKETETRQKTMRRAVAAVTLTEKAPTMLQMHLE